MSCMGFEYNVEKECLTVLFPDESIYDYEEVKEPMYQKLMKAPSMGSFFVTEIKSNYICKRYKR
jgi:hypothetical protein